LTSLPRGRRLATAAGALIALGVIALGPLALRYAPYALAVATIEAKAQQLDEQIGRLQIADVDRAHVAQLRSGLGGLAADIELLRLLIADDPLIGLARNLASVDRVLTHAGAVLEAADDLAHAGSAALDLADQFVALREESGTSGHSLLAGLTELMAGSTDDVDRVHDLITHAGGLLTSVPPDANKNIRRAADVMAGAIDRYGPLLDQFRAVDHVLPGIIGWATPRRYLVLAQDPAELRPTGGYIGTVGTVAFSDGTLSERAFKDVYLLDFKPMVHFVQPPDALANHLLGNHSWQLADAAWSPDFPTAAQNALRLYSLESGDTNIDGVIALTTYAVDRLLEVTGPVDVPEYSATVAAGEVTLTALRLTRPTEEAPTSERKAFLDTLAGAVIDRLYALPIEKWPQLFDAFVDMGNKRMLQVWFTDPEAQSLVASAAIGGELRQDAGDYLYVVEANLSPTSKYNLVVDRRDTLQVTLGASGDASSVLRMDWQNNALTPGEPYASIREYSESKVGLYGAYLRVLTPATSALLSTFASGADPIDAAEEVSSDAGRNVFGNFLLIEPGTADLAYSWTTPGAAAQSGDVWTYSLTIQKQPGLRPMPLSVSVALPPGATVETISDGATAGDGRVTFETTLVEDAQLEVQYRLP
jgi:hypothetical protein